MSSSAVHFDQAQAPAPPRACVSPSDAIRRARQLEHWARTAGENLRRIVGDDDPQSLAALAGIVERHQRPPVAALMAA